MIQKLLGVELGSNGQPGKQILLDLSQGGVGGQGPTGPRGATVPQDSME